MEKVTYNKIQLMAFSKKELATIDLSSGIDMKLKKDVIVKEMLKVQKSEIEATKAQPEVTETVAIEETTTDESTDTVNEEVATQLESEAPIEQVEGNVEEVEEAVSSEKPVFHRPVRTRNRMGF